MLVLNEKSVMAYGGKGREGTTSRQESDGSYYKESAKSDVKMTAGKIRKLVAKFSIQPGTARAVSLL